MSAEAFDWNVLVVGAWNRAILTPEWISKEILTTGGEPVNIEVVLNNPQVPPIRVRYDDLIVVVPGHLEIVTTKCDAATLDKARECALKAIAALPRTPLVAAGFNVRYRWDELPDELPAAVKCDVDRCLVDAGKTTVTRQVQRIVEFGDGQLNIEIRTPAKEGNAAAEILFNFHRASKDHGDLESWLRTPIQEAVECVHDIMGRIPGMTL